MSNKSLIMCNAIVNPRKNKRLSFINLLIKKKGKFQIDKTLTIKNIS